MAAQRKPTLPDIQRWMSRAILRGNAAVGLAPAASGLAVTARIAGGSDVRDRLAVHINGYPARVREALLESFPAVHRVLGDSAFTSLVYRFLPHLPRKEYNLNRVGRALVQFLRTDLLAESLPFLADLARLEWQLVEAFHAPTEEPFQFDRCAGWTLDQWQRARLSFQPFVSLTFSPWPIREIWEARTKPPQEINVDLEGRPDRVLVYRQGLAVECESLGKAEAAALSRLLAGQLLGEAIEALARAQVEPDLVMSWFGRWAAAGLVASVSTPPRPTQPKRL